MNNAILRGSNIKGGMFLCFHIHTFEHLSTRDVQIYLENYFSDNSMKFHILTCHIKLIFQFYCFGFQFLVKVSVLTNLLFYFKATSCFFSVLRQLKISKPTSQPGKKTNKRKNTKLPYTLFHHKNIHHG